MCQVVLKVLRLWTQSGSEKSDYIQGDVWSPLCTYTLQVHYQHYQNLEI